MSVTYTKVSSQKLTNGLVSNIYDLTLDNAYPVAGYDVSTPANFGLSMFQLKDSLVGFVDPRVIGTKNGKVIAEIVALKLLLAYPTGGSIAAPTTPAAPSSATVVVTTTPDAGAVAVTGSAAKPALVGVMTGGLTPGLAKAFPDAADASAIHVLVNAVGYPA